MRQPDQTGRGEPVMVAGIGEKEGWVWGLLARERLPWMNPCADRKIQLHLRIANSGMHPCHTFIAIV